MASGRRHPIDDLRGVSRLAVDATTGVTDLVQDMHRAVAGGPAALGRPLAVPAELFSAPVFASIRGITRLVGAGIEVALSQFAHLVEERSPVPEQEALLGALNGVVGDHLALTENPLAIEMCLRKDYQSLVLERAALAERLPEATSRMVVFVHGSCMTDRQWCRDGHDHSAALGSDLGATTLHVVYNSGLHISENGRLLGPLLDRLVQEWPVPVEELSLVGHSMGGLVCRSACHQAEASVEGWLGKLRRLVCLGSPHHGTALERGGNWIGVLLGVSRYSAPFARLARIRSAGVTDLRHGNVLDEHWAGRDRFGAHGDLRKGLWLPKDVAVYFVAGTLSERPGPVLRGDGLVSVDSALGRHRSPELTLQVPPSHELVAYGTGHLGLLSSAEVYSALCRWFSS